MKKTMRILTIFGTRPEVIKLAPVIQQLELRHDVFSTVNVSSSQHTNLLYPFVQLFGLRIDYDLKVMRAGQTLNGLCARVLKVLDPILERERPDLILVQGDTTTAVAGALAGFHRLLPVGHVEAGLRTGNNLSPYPEEMNRRLISRVAMYHFAPTPGNRDNLLSEGVLADHIFVTGNPVVDSLLAVREAFPCLPSVNSLLQATDGMRRVLLTTHRRESFGDVMARNLFAIRRFVDRHDDIALIFPVHPNPAVTATAQRLLRGHPRIRLIPPLNYHEFVVLLKDIWLIVSDSGGVQQEAPTVRRPLLILRENTEAPEAVACGVARLVGGDPARLASMLEEVYADGLWAESLHHVHNPFGRGDSGRRIVDVIERLLGVSSMRCRAESRSPVIVRTAVSGAARAVGS